MFKHTLSRLSLSLIIITAAASCILNLAFAGPTAGYQDLDQRISLDADKQTLKQTLDKIASQAHIAIIYSNLKGLVNKEVTVHVKDQPVTKVLDDLLRPLSLSYEIIDNHVIIKFVPSESKPPTPGRLDIKHQLIKGRVINDSSSPLYGVTIRAKGGLVLATTDKNGEFQIDDIANSTILSFSIVGYHTKELMVHNSEYLNVTLQSNALLLNEVNIVSTGYQAIPKERATGSFDQVDNKLVNRSTSTNILDRLSGIASGLRFNGTALNSISTSPGNRLLGINIRGESKLSNNVGRDPLIVLDNFPYEGNISNTTRTISRA